MLRPPALPSPPVVPDPHSAQWAHARSREAVGAEAEARLGPCLQDRIPEGGR